MERGDSRNLGRCSPIGDFESCCPRAAVSKRALPCETHQGLLLTRTRLW